MKKDTLKSYAYGSRREETNVWKILGDISKEAGDDHAAGKQAVLDMVISVGLRRAIAASADKECNVDKQIRSVLSHLNEKYPFDVVTANNEVKRLYSTYLELTSGWTGLETMCILRKTLDDVSRGNEIESPQITKAQLAAFDYL